MNKFLRQAQQLQAQLAKAQEELASLTLEATAGGGAVKVTVDGQQNIKSIKISPEVVSREDTELLEDMVLAGINEALEKSRKAAQDRLGGLTGGLKIPGM
ncbi:MAG: YbaB/EbfC family nucleoid-associated protein [Dehalococcoidia bacterium]|jgi:DNA-binding YbaB/EbfC family protein|nr:MAG: YbaB/EbfC family nucleoid-associated protein [Dehalococcoidia bacterium]